MIITFFIGVCIGVLGTAFLYNKNYKILETESNNTSNNYEEIIQDLKNEINSYKDIVTSLNKEIEKLKK